MRAIAWDTETALIRPGVLAPELACVTHTEHAGPPHAQDPRTYLARIRDAATGLLEVRAWLSDPDVLLVGQNIAFDMAVIMQADPELIPLVFAAYEANRVTDTMLRQQLLDIAAGCFRGEYKGIRFVKYDYSLDALARRFLQWQLDKDTWRLRYGELIGIPLAQWPEGARTYPLDDARATMGVYLKQEEHADYLDDQYRQARRALWLHLASAWGLRTYLPGVEEFAKEVDANMGEALVKLQSLGLVKRDGVRDTKAAARLMVEVCQAKGLAVVPTKTAEDKVKAGGKFDPTLLEGVALDADSCKRAEDPRLELYADYGVLKAVQSKDLDMLRGGTQYPLHPRFGIVETGRTSCSKPNVQNVRTLPGIRECFCPRCGWVYGQGDYPGLELKTLAQSCIWLVGGSVLGRVINEGKDPHLILASQLAHCTYEQAEKLYKADKDWHPRKLAKVANFGFPGGLGYRTFLEYAAGKPYNITIGEDEARHLKQTWLNTWVEMKDYFNLVSQMCEAQGGEALVKHPGSNRYRGRTRYTAACNGFFQGLGADATGYAGWRIAQAMYVDEASPLFGCRTVNYVHDEFIAEIPDNELASDAVLCMVEIMRTAANEWLPDVPFTPGSIEPCLMSHWSKAAKTIIVDGRVQVWRG